ncbi:hypothetical protein SFRURICE_015928 [Spodoptera frugiperda]|nr:hypothetical protein SFRURICE_015928 [Spodoptera frugiperda]
MEKWPQQPVTSNPKAKVIGSTIVVWKRPSVQLGRGFDIKQRVGRQQSVLNQHHPGTMACKIAFFTAALFLILALSQAAPAEEKPAETLNVEAEKDDLETADKDDLKTAASHWGGHWGGYGGHYGGHWGYPSYYGYGWGYPSYGYGYWPYGGIYGHGYGGYGHYGWW